MKISSIAAIGKDRELGKDNKLLWNIPEDLNRFREITKGHAIIMGRKTFESIGRVLPNRTNIIITRDLSFSVPNALIVHSLKEAIEKASRCHNEILKQVQDDKREEEVFIIGGGQIYAESLKENLVDKLYLTIVEGEYDADTFFPDYSDFKKVVFEKSSQNEKYKYKFVELEKE